MRRARARWPRAIPGCAERPRRVSQTWGRDSYAGGGFGAPRLTPVVKGLLIANVAVFLLQGLVQLIFRGPYLELWLGLWPEDVFTRGYVWQLITYAFLHDTRSLLHILFNMLFLFWFGRDIELRIGPRRLLILYFGSALAGALAFSLVRLATGAASGPVIGASGAVMALLVLAGIYWPDRMILVFFLFPMKLRHFVILAIAIDLWNEIFGAQAGVAGLAHLGGAAFGLAFHFLEPAWRTLDERLRQAAYRRAQAGAAEREAALNRILDKVHEHGIHTLSSREKRFLKRISEEKKR